jgi:hypothetical protein
LVSDFIYLCLERGSVGKFFELATIKSVNTALGSVSVCVRFCGFITPFPASFGVAGQRAQSARGE